MYKDEGYGSVPEQGAATKKAVENSSYKKRSKPDDH